MLQGPKTVLDPVAPLPGPDEPWPTDGRIETHHVELLLSGLTDDDDRHRTIRRTGRTQPRIAHPRHLLARPPRPPAVLLQVLPLDLTPIGQCEDIGTLPFHKECALMRGGHMAHELRIAEPTIRHDHRWGQLDAASAEGCHASIEHALHPTEFVTTRSARPLRIRATDGKIHGDHEFALTNDDHQEEPINTGEHPMFLAAPPRTNKAQLIAVLFEDRIIRNPGPLPAAACRLTSTGGMAP